MRKSLHTSGLTPTAAAIILFFGQPIAAPKAPRSAAENAQERVTERKKVFLFVEETKKGKEKAPFSFSFSPLVQYETAALFSTFHYAPPNEKSMS